jgi:hypothetical protein
LKDVDSRVFTRMLRRTDGSITISLRNFVGEGIKWIIRETMVDIIQNTKVWAT